MKKLFYLCLFLLVVGCMPYPHTYQGLPDVSGSLYDNGKPVNGAQIYLGEITRDNCFKVTQEPVTSSFDGSFKITGIRRIRLYILGVPAESIETWALRISMPDRPAVIYARKRGRPGPVAAPEFVKIQCDLSTDNVCEIIDERDAIGWKQ